MAQARNSSADKKSPSYFDGRHRFRGEAGVHDRVTSTAGSGLFLFLGSNLETTPARRSRRTGRDLTIQQSVCGSLRMTLRNYRSSITRHSAHQTHFGGSSAGRLVRRQDERWTSELQKRSSARAILSLLWPARPWRPSSRRLPEPFPWPGLRRPSAVSDRSRRPEASSPVRSFPSPQPPPSSREKGLPAVFRPKVNSL
jgi:hypothetical protein